MIKVAVVGLGSMGRNHVRVLMDIPEVEVVGVADIDAKSVESIAKRYGVKAYTDFSKLLDEQRPDAVTIAVPTVNHLDVAIEAIERHVAVLIEKPIAFSIDEGQRMIAAAERSGATFMVGHVERFNPAVIALKQHLLDGELGQVFQIDAHRQGPFPVRVVDVGVVIDLAVHDLDVMRYVTGAQITRVYAETGQRIHSTCDDLLAGLVRMNDGTIGSLTINWLTPTKIRELYVTGERGMFRVDYLTQDLYFYENATARGDDWETLRILRGVSEGRMIRPVIAKKEPLRAEQEAFLKAVRGEAPVAVSGADGLKALQLAHALVASGQRHQAVEISE